MTGGQEQQPPVTVRANPTQPNPTNGASKSRAGGPRHVNVGRQAGADKKGRGQRRAKDGWTQRALREKQTDTAPRESRAASRPAVMSCHVNRLTRRAPPERDRLTAARQGLLVLSDAQPSKGVKATYESKGVVGRAPGRGGRYWCLVLAEPWRRLADRHRLTARSPRQKATATRCMRRAGSRCSGCVCA